MPSQPAFPAPQVWKGPGPMMTAPCTPTPFLFTWPPHLFAYPFPSLPLAFHPILLSNPFPSFPLSFHPILLPYPFPSRLLSFTAPVLHCPIPSLPLSFPSPFLRYHFFLLPLSFRTSILSFFSKKNLGPTVGQKSYRIHFTSDKISYSYILLCTRYSCMPLFLSRNSARFLKNFVRKGHRT